MTRRFDPTDPGLRAFARGQRRTMPTAEGLFWQQVPAGRLNGLKFKRQVPIPPYVADFLCASARLVVELDGAPHETAQRKLRDAKRDAWLREQGFRVLRFPNDLVLGNLGLVLDAVTAAVSASSPPPSAGEGGPCVSRGRERGATAPDEAKLSRASAATPPALPAPSLPSPPLLRRVPSPAEGGGGAARDRSGARPSSPSGSGNDRP